MSTPSESTGTEAQQDAKMVSAKSARFVDGPGYCSFYCNNIGFAVNQLDIVLHLGEILDVSPEAEATVERRARVTMNPAQAKALSTILSYAVAMYEKQSKRTVEDLPMNLQGLPTQ